MKQDFRQGISEMANAIRQLVAVQNANAATAEAAEAQAVEEARNNLGQNANGLGQAGQNQAAGEGGPNLNQGDGLLEDHRDRVKLIRDIHWTLRAISKAPLLSSTNLSDFDQWANELMNAIKTAKTDEARYNRINIDFIYSSIDLDLRDQATGHVPSKLHLVHLITPEAYLADLERLYTPADHLSARRTEFEGRKQQPTESPMAYLAIMLRLYTRAKLNDETYLVEKFLMGFLNKALRNEIIMHHKGAQTYETMRKAVVECHTSFTKAIRMGTGTPTFNLTGLA